MEREVRWERMFPDELEAAFAASPVLYMPYGLCEPHGPQNTLGLDALKAHALCCRAARAGGGIVAPPDYWHIHEVGHYAAWARREVGEVARTWLTAVPPWVHFRNVCYHVRAAEVLGFRAVILLTGHYGPNWQDLKTLVGLIQPRVRARLYGLPDFEANVPGFDVDGNSGGDHAGRIETSLLWSLEPSCVDPSRLPPLPLDPPGAVGRYFAMGRDAHAASRRIGDRMVDDEVAFLTAKAAELRAAYDDAAPPAGSFRTFEDVERFWAEAVVPILGTFRSMDGYLAVTDEVAAIPDDSVWRANASGPLRG